MIGDARHVAFRSAGYDKNDIAPVGDAEAARQSGKHDWRGQCDTEVVGKKAPTRVGIVGMNGYRDVATLIIACCLHVHKKIFGARML